MDVTTVPNPQEVFGSVNISANITDNYQLYGAWVEIYDSGGYFIGNFSLNHDSGNIQYFWIQNYDQLGIYSYIIFTNDTSNNWASQSGSFVIQDTTPPEITNILKNPEPQEVFGYVNISANVIDNYQLSEVWIDIFYPEGSVIGSFPMNLNSLDEKYYMNLPYDLLGTFTFTISANDSSNNLGSSSGLFIIHDTTPPILVNVTSNPNPQEVFGAVEISANVTDNYHLSGVWVEIYHPNGTYLGNNSMFYNPSIDKYYWNQNYESLGNYTFLIWARDTSLNWGSISGIFKVWDTTPPTISDWIITYNEETPGFFNISAKVTDNYQISLVWIEISNPNGNAYGILKMNYDLSKSRYYSNISYNNSGTYSLLIRASDTSDNEASSSKSIFIEPPTESLSDPDEFNWKPVIALIFAIVMLIMGMIITYIRPIKFSDNITKNRLNSFLLGVLPFVVIELMTGLISYFTGLLSIPPIIGIGTVIDLSILIVGLFCILFIYAKGIPEEFYVEEVSEPNQVTDPSKKLDNIENEIVEPTSESLPPPPPPPNPTSPNKTKYSLILV
jgi:hypothetical protein